MSYEDRHVLDDLENWPKNVIRQCPMIPCLRRSPFDVKQRTTLNRLILILLWGLNNFHHRSTDFINS